MGKVKIVISIIVLVVLVSALGAVNRFNGALDAPLTKPEVEVTVEEGDMFYTVLERMSENGDAKSFNALKLAARRNGIAPNIKPGTYILNDSMDLYEVAEALTEGSPEEMVTFPEGSTVNDVARILENNDVMSKEEFLKACDEYTAPSYIPEIEGRVKLEGYLYPDTYSFKEGITGEEVIDIMLARFEEVTTELLSESGLTDISAEEFDELVILASIIEREAVIKEERDIVSSVFHNRVEKDMMLQSCATVIYAIGDEFYDRESLILYYSDLEIQSEYNTYMYSGFPIGPIASPGYESLYAAINPADTDYIFFVALNDGTHFFTDDYNEFLKVREETQGF